MSVRELVVLGTASRVPTRYRNHNGYLLRWDGRNMLFDPGEGTQRQFTLAGVSPATVTAMFVTHFHGDHSLGLAGMIQRLSHERVARTVPVAYPESGQAYFERLRAATIFDDRTLLAPRPLGDEPTVWEDGDLRIEARPLDHRVPALGYRISEPAGFRFDPARLEAAGVRGPDVSRLQAAGELRRDGRRITLADVGDPRPGASFAFIMDTRACPGAAALARDASLAVIEATFLERDRDMAEEYGHLTAAGAARLAVEAGVERLVLTHFSQRYGDVEPFLEEAGAIHPDCVLAEDLQRVAVPRPRVRSGGG